MTEFTFNRDIEALPYSTEELRVVEYLHKLMPDIGAGSDPIGFLIASHAALRHRAGKAVDIAPVDES